ncbi:unnamed protein product [Schistocephalus solidus]|uniref:DUF3727 domain-containing protein n=1 Tax=Schistocephalus solidus TaxID=70667 RepID=A0A183SGQ9_SCHSO|nr:unnamed protein product [Schistocephalus solidus]
MRKSRLTSKKINFPRPLHFLSSVCFFVSSLQITSQERDLIINFVTEKLRPLIVDGELKSYQIELVEQHDNPPCSLLSADPETVCLTSDLPHPSSNPPSAPLLLRVCSSTCQPIPDQFDSSSPSSPDLPSGTTACSNKIAVVRLSNPPTAQSDSILLYTFDRTDSFANCTYRIQDLQFFGPDILVVLLYRDSLPADDLIASPPPSSQSVSRGLQWFIFLPLDETLKCSTGQVIPVGSFCPA